jgi:hypothetical protein
MNNTSAVEIAEDDAEEESIDDDEVVQDSICDKVTKQMFSEMLTRAATGQDLLPIIDRLPNSSQCYGHSIATNAVIKIISCHSAFRASCDNFYTLKVKKETKGPATYSSLTLSS